MVVCRHNGGDKYCSLTRWREVSLLAQVRPDGVLERVPVVLQHHMSALPPCAVRRQTHLVERPREAPSHAVLLREERLVPEGPRVVVGDDDLARRVVKERRVAAVVPSCQKQARQPPSVSSAGARRTHGVPVRLAVRPVRVLLERAERDELVERDLLSKVRAEVARGRLRDDLVLLRARVRAVQRVRLAALLLLFLRIALLARARDGTRKPAPAHPEAAIGEPEHLLRVRAHVEPGLRERDLVEDRLGALRDVPVQREAEHQLRRGEARRGPLRERRLRRVLRQRRVPAQVPERRVRPRARGRAPGVVVPVRARRGRVSLGAGLWEAGAESDSHDVRVGHDRGVRGDVGERRAVRARPRQRRDGSRDDL